MAAKITLALCGLVLAIQTSFAQYRSGNSIVDNNVIVNSGASSALGWGNGGLGNGVGLGSGLGLGAGVGLGAGLGLGSGIGWNSGLGVVGGRGIGGGIGLGLGSGNSVVDNTVVVNSGASSGLGLGLGWNSGLGLGSSVVAPAYIDLISVSGGGVLPVSSYGPIAPAGINVVSDNAIEGAVLVSGQLPFLSAVAFEGALASGGSGAASCGCGNGNIGIISETGNPAAVLPAVGGRGVGVGLGGLRGIGGVNGLIL